MDCKGEKAELHEAELLHLLVPYRIGFSLALDQKIECLPESELVSLSKSLSRNIRYAFIFQSLIQLFIGQSMLFCNIDCMYARPSGGFRTI